ncbi:MAG TPA: carboxypeptidase-like regulatory domain-containing protein, partial [Vicinamibacterales bacterium]|nr:carboxypeptidase-like regulatory domain-containing protein [Vicinamibacterales bacterium]
VDHKSAAHLVVGEWLRGEKVGQKVVIDVTGAAFACNAYGFAEGVTYMVHASRGEHGEWRVWKCGGTAPLAFAAAALKYARESSRGNAPGRLYGFGFIDERPDPNDQGGPPLVGGALRLSSDRRTFATTTDAKGDYRFDGIPPGEYTLHITHAGIQALPPKRFVVGTEACIFYPFWSRPRHVQEESLCPQ